MRTIYTLLFFCVAYFSVPHVAIGQQPTTSQYSVQDGITVSIYGNYPDGYFPKWDFVGGPRSVEFIQENNVAPRMSGQTARLSVQLIRHNGKTGLLLEGYCFGELVGLPALLTEKPRMFRLANFQRPDGKRPDCAKMSRYQTTFDGIVRMSADKEGNVIMDFAIEVYSDKGTKSYGYRADGVVMKNLQTPQSAWASVDAKDRAEKERKAAFAKQQALIAEIKAKANGGDLKSMALLGYMYFTGDHAPIDKPEAVKWYRMAAAKGDVDSMFRLGLIHAKGDGVEQNDAEAVRYYRLAAAKGKVEAMYNLGFMAKEGRGMPASLSEAKRWMRMAAEKGFDPAISWLKAYNID